MCMVIDDALQSGARTTRRGSFVVESGTPVWAPCGTRVFSPEYEVGRVVIQV